MVLEKAKAALGLVCAVGDTREAIEIGFPFDAFYQCATRSVLVVLPLYVNGLACVVVILWVFICLFASGLGMFLAPLAATRIMPKMRGNVGFATTGVFLILRRLECFLTLFWIFFATMVFESLVASEECLTSVIQCLMRVGIGVSTLCGAALGRLRGFLSLSLFNLVWG
ncbi:hypothetical protein SUGI_0546820 [Cryptomeria japonica]|nr:hypothetical protein SUGI_0546820 [Cryptomeria japonica]